MAKGFAIILSAPSGTGKTTTCKFLRERLPDLKISVSHTTRTIRNGETDGVDYIFISQKEFEDKIKNNDFLEWACVHDFHYGTSLQSVDTILKRGCDTLLELDVQGVEALRKMQYQGIYILILPPLKRWRLGLEKEERIQKNTSNSESKLEKRKSKNIKCTITSSPTMRSNIR